MRPLLVVLVLLSVGCSSTPPYSPPKKQVQDDPIPLGCRCICIVDPAIETPDAPLERKYGLPLMCRCECVLPERRRDRSDEKEGVTHVALERTVTSTKGKI